MDEREYQRQAAQLLVLVLDQMLRQAGLEVSRKGVRTPEADFGAEEVLTGLCRDMEFRRKTEAMIPMLELYPDADARFRRKLRAAIEEFVLP